MTQWSAYFCVPIQDIYNMLAQLNIDNYRAEKINNSIHYYHMAQKFYMDFNFMYLWLVGEL